MNEPLSLNPERFNQLILSLVTIHQIGKVFVLLNDGGTHSSKMDWKKIEIKLSFIC